MAWCTLSAICSLKYRYPETRKMEKVAKLLAKPFLWWKNLQRGVNLARVFAAERKPGLEGIPTFASPLEVEN